MTGYRLVLGLSPAAGSTEPAAVRRHYSELASVAQAAVAAGFDGFGVSEHHWRADGYCPDALGLLGSLAAIASPRVVMTSIVPLPFWKASLLAERAAVVEAVSGAEVYLGVGGGCDEIELAECGWRRDEIGRRTEEAVHDLLTYAERGLSSVFTGRHLLLGAMTLGGVRRAARLGLGWVSDPRASIAELTRLREAYARAGGTGPVVLMRDGHIGIDSDWLTAIESDHDYFWKTPRVGLGDRRAPASLKVGDVLLYGGEDQVRRQLEHLASEVPFDALYVRIHVPLWKPRKDLAEQLSSWVRLQRVEVSG